MIAWHVAFYLLAVHFALYDEKNGTFLRSLVISWFNLTSSPEKKIISADFGFVFNKKIRSKISFATIFALTLSILFSLISSSFDIAMEIILFFSKTLVITLGFYSVYLFKQIYEFCGFIVKTVEENEVSEFSENTEETVQKDCPAVEVLAPQIIIESNETSTPSDEELLGKLNKKVY